MKITQLRLETEYYMDDWVIVSLDIDKHPVFCDRNLRWKRSPQCMSKKESDKLLIRLNQIYDS